MSIVIVSVTGSLDEQADKAARITAIAAENNRRGWYVRCWNWRLVQRVKHLHPKVGWGWAPNEESQTMHDFVSEWGGHR